MKAKLNDYVYHFTGLGGKVIKVEKAWLHVSTQLGVRLWNHEDVTVSLHSQIRNGLLRFFKWFFKVK
jgi:hypothetical protein